MLSKFYFLILVVDYLLAESNSRQNLQELGGEEKSYKWSFSRKKENETLEFHLRIDLDHNNHNEDDQVEKINVTDGNNRSQEILVKKESNSENVLSLTTNQPLTLVTEDQGGEAIAVNNSDQNVATEQPDMASMTKGTTPKNPFDHSRDFLDRMLFALVNATFPYVNETEMTNVESGEQKTTLNIFERTIAPILQPNEKTDTATVGQENAAVLNANESTTYFSRCIINDKTDQTELVCKWTTAANRQLDIFSRRKFDQSHFCELRARNFDDCRRTCELNGQKCSSIHFCRSCTSESLNCRLLMMTNGRRVFRGGKNRQKLIAEYGGVDYSEKYCGDEQESDEDDDDSGDESDKRT